jgi:hypothetical protein
MLRLLLEEIFSFLQSVQTGCGAHPRVFFNANCALSLRIKRPGSEVGHSPPASAEGKNDCSYTSIPFYDFKTCKGTTLLLPSHKNSLL